MRKWKMPELISSSIIWAKEFMYWNIATGLARGGTYETGLATVQCAYAPEYASHSAGGTVIIK